MLLPLMHCHFLPHSGARCFGPIGQGAFFHAMGAADRAEALLEEPHVTDEQAGAIVSAFERLVDPAQMGTKYKVRSRSPYLILLCLIECCSQMHFCCALTPCVYHMIHCLYTKMLLHRSHQCRIGAKGAGCGISMSPALQFAAMLITK